MADEPRRRRRSRSPGAETEPSVGAEPSPLLGGLRGLAQVALATAVLVAAAAVIAFVVATLA